jgi:Rieske Fe-S protein
MTATEMVPVTELYVRCSYPMRPDVLAASDTCQHPANTAVRGAGGSLWWRCPAHEGQMALGRRGEVVTSVPRPVTPGEEESS